MQTFFFI